LILAALTAAAAGLSGCGGGSKLAQVAVRPAGDASFVWLRPMGTPAGWRVAAIPNGAAMPYPAGWSRTRSDAGTASAVLSGTRDRVLGYLDLTPLQGAETLSNWSHFRVDHNREEGDRQVRTLAAQTGLRFRSGRGSCVLDAYTTKTDAHFIEIACLVKGQRATSVIVGASPPSAWVAVAPLLERAISTFTT
jgi:hypothetical protein